MEFFRFLCGWVAVVFCVSCSAETAFVALRTEAQVERREIRLSDIADVTSKNAETSAHLGRAIVARLTTLASPQSVGLETISRELSANPETSGIDVVWGANSSVKISGRVYPVSLQSAAEAGAVHLMSLVGKGRKIALQVVEPLDLVEAPAGKVAAIPLFKEISFAGSRFDVPVDIRVDGTSVARTVISYRVESTETEIPVGRTITSSAGQIDLANQKAGVVRGQKVRMIYRSGAVQMESEGIALASAAPGEIISVRRPGNGSDLSGRVLDSGTVKVEEN